MIYSSNRSSSAFQHTLSLQQCTMICLFFFKFYLLVCVFQYYFSTCWTSDECLLIRWCNWGIVKYWGFWLAHFFCFLWLLFHNMIFALGFFFQWCSTDLPSFFFAFSFFFLSVAEVFSFRIHRHQKRLYLNLINFRLSFHCHLYYLRK